MRDEDHKPPTPEDADLERESRPHRKFSLADAIGRAGGDLMKGASPVTRRRQAEFEIERCLEASLDDPEGALRVVVQRWVRESEAFLAEGYEDPPAALARWARSILASEALLRRLVRDADAEWGRIYLEHPHFDRAGDTPDRDDPYTPKSVRGQLEGLLAAADPPAD